MTTPFSPTIDGGKTVVATDEIPMEPVRSSNIARLGYDAERRILQVQFHPPGGFRWGSIWRYADVSPEEFEALKSARSPGSVFTYSIKRAKKASIFRGAEPGEPEQS